MKYTAGYHRADKHAWRSTPACSTPTLQESAPCRACSRSEELLFTVVAACSSVTCLQCNPRPSSLDAIAVGASLRKGCTKIKGDAGQKGKRR